MTILQILNEIASDNGRNHKEAVLKKHADNELLKRACYLAYDPMVQFYQQKIPAYIAKGNQPLSVTLSTDLSPLIERKVTGNEAIEYLKALLERSSPEDAKVIEKIVLKDFDVGIAESTILKVWSGLLSEYPMLLTSAFKYSLLEKLIARPGVKYAQAKSDGARVNIKIAKDGGVSVFSRKGREIYVRGHFDWLGQIEALRGHILDGELLARDPETRRPLPRKTGNGLVNKAIKGTLPENEMEILYLTAWDIITQDEFDARKGTKKYVDRFEKLKWFVTYMGMLNSKSNVELIESFEITTVEDAIEVGERYIALGQEGAIIKHGDMLWGDERSKLGIKIKAERECDLKIVGVQPGEGKYRGLIGAYICESACGQLRVNVNVRGDDDRAANPDDVIGKILGVLYNEKIKSKSKKAGEPQWSLFLPRVHPDKGIRIDKTTADTLENIE